MAKFTIQAASEQFAAHLRGELLRGQWRGKMWGSDRLAAKYGIGPHTVEAALRKLEQEGLLANEGRRRGRRILVGEQGWRGVGMSGGDRPARARGFRVRIMLYEKHDRGEAGNSALLARLLEEGFDVDFADKTLKDDLGMKVERVARHVRQNPADAWVVIAASRDILEWFSGQATPSIAMYGQSGGLLIAAAFVVMIPSLRASVRRLIDLGHRRIVMLAREERRKPRLALPEQAFVDQLRAAGIKTGVYNLPDWEESREGLGRRLDELFRYSPPTALIFQEAPIYVAVRTYLADRGILAPRDVSLVVIDRDVSFAWSTPMPAHIQWDYLPVVRRVVRWARNVAAGKDDRRQSGSGARFIEGGTIGPAPN